MKQFIRLALATSFLVTLSVGISSCTSTNSKSTSYEKSKSAHESQQKSYGY